MPSSEYMRGYLKGVQECQMVKVKVKTKGVNKSYTRWVTEEKLKKDLEEEESVDWESWQSTNGY